MESIPRRVKRYIWLSVVPAVAVIALAAAVDHGPSVPRPWLVYPLMIVMAWVGEEYRVLTQRGASQTLTTAIHLLLILLFTPLEAVLLAALGCICAQRRRRRSMLRVAYNAVVRVISIGVPAVGLTVAPTRPSV